MMRAFRERRAFTGVVVLAVAAVVTVAVTSAVRGGTAGAVLAPPAGLPGDLTGPAPWPRNAGLLRERLSAIRLPTLAAEGTVLHIHQHLDVFVEGRRVVVPARIGIVLQPLFFSPIHTHDPSGIVHVESPTVQTFTLGQVFAVWGVRFTPTCLGGYCSSGVRKLRVYSNGTLVQGDPRRVPLSEREEIVVAFGTRAQLPRPIRSSYAFPAGL
jgi:hypothetical protein